jgi:hypothetical protein
MVATAILSACSQKFPRLPPREHPTFVSLPSSPNPLLPKREKGNRIQNPSPALGEGFRVRAAKLGCTPTLFTNCNSSVKVRIYIPGHLWVFDPR